MWDSNPRTDLLEVAEDAPVGDEDDEEGDEEPEGHEVQRVREVGRSMPGRATTEIDNLLAAVLLKLYSLQCCSAEFKSSYTFGGWHLSHEHQFLVYHAIKTVL